MGWVNGVLCAVVFCVTSAFAADNSVVEFTGAITKVAGLSVTAEAKLKVDGKEASLKLSGAGVRKKAGVLPLYVVSSYVEDLTTLRRAKTFLEGVKAQKNRVLRLTMATPLKARQIQDAFIAALDLNEIPTASDPFKSILSSWDRDLKARESATIIASEKADGTQVLIFELPGKTIRNEGKGIADAMWTVWFGKGDSNMQEVAEALVGKE